MMNSIGTKKEKDLHRFLKNYFSPRQNQEIFINKWIVDAFIDGIIYEIQTKAFNTLRRKLADLLPKYPITIVYPIAQVKYLYWISQNGIVQKPRKSPKANHPLKISLELYRIKPFLTNPNLKVKIVMLELHEYKKLDGYSKDLKKGSSTFKQEIKTIFSIIELKTAKDYLNLIPYDNNITFTTNDLIKDLKLTPREGYSAIQVLKEVKAIKFVGKKGRSYLYQKNNVD